jgi:hypothetical protein
MLLALDLGGQPPHGIVLAVDPAAEGVCAIEPTVLFPTVALGDEARFVCGRQVAGNEFTGFVVVIVGRRTIFQAFFCGLYLILHVVSNGMV